MITKFKIFEVINNNDDYDRYSLFKEYTIFRSEFRGKISYYILKNRGNECQQIYFTRDGELQRTKDKYRYKPDIYTLFNEYVYDSNTLEDVLNELEIILLTDKFNI